MIQQYIDYLTSIRGYSKNTAKAYGRDLQTFVNWAKANLQDARWSAITRDDIDRYIKCQVEQGKAPASTNRHLSAISGLYVYFKRQGYQIDNPCKYESRRKLAKTIPNTIPIEDLRKAYLGTHGVAHYMIGILATTGMRLQELLDLEWSSIDWETRVIKVEGKGRKQRITYTTTEVLEELRPLYEYAHGKGRIFCTDQRNARYILWDALRQYSSAKQLSPHAIRHTVATNMAKQGANVTTIANLLGHSDISTTQKYIDMTQASIKDACTQFSII